MILPADWEPRPGAAYYDPGESVVFRLPAGGYAFGVVADEDDGSDLVGVACLRMEGGEPRRHYFRVLRSLCIPQSPEEQYENCRRPNSFTSPR